MRILLVEDNPGDVRLIQEAFKASKVRADITVAGDGEQALAYLYNHSPFTDSQTPDLILLDLNLPKVDGKEVLMRVKSDPRLRVIPVAVLSSSRSQDDIVSSYNNFANCYIPKPMSFDAYLTLVKGLEEFWMRVASLPVVERPRRAAAYP